MIRTVFRNVLALGILVAICAIYFAKYANTVPKEWMLVMNFLVVPALLGGVAYIVFAGERLIRFALVSVIPILSILLAGGDQAKPGLELVLIGPLLTVFWLGASVPFSLQWFLSNRKAKSQ